MARMRDEGEEAAMLHRERVAADMRKHRNELTDICAKHLNGEDPDLVFAKTLQFWLKSEKITANQMRMAGYMYGEGAFASGRLLNAAAIAIHNELRSHDTTTPYPMNQDGLSEKTKAIIASKTLLSTELSSGLQHDLSCLIRPLHRRSLSEGLTARDEVTDYRALVDNLYKEADKITASITARNRAATRGTSAHDDAFANAVAEMLSASPIHPMELIHNRTVQERQGRIFEAALTLAIRPIIQAMTTEKDARTDEDRRLPHNGLVAHYMGSLQSKLSEYYIPIAYFIAFAAKRRDLVSPDGRIMLAAKTLYKASIEERRASLAGGGASPAAARAALAAGVVAVRQAGEESNDPPKPSHKGV